MTGADRVFLKDVTCVDNLRELFDKLNFFHEELHVLNDKPCHERCPEEVSYVPLLVCLDLSPLRVLPTEEFLVRKRAQLRIVEHLSMDKAQAFQGDHGHVHVNLIDGLQEAEAELLLFGDEHVYDVAEGKLVGGVPIRFTVVIDPVDDIGLNLLLFARELQVVQEGTLLGLIRYK